MARAVLVIADIGGYTKFMKVHRINLAHAQYIVAQLLESVIDGAGKLKLAKLEGDAAFFYATLPTSGATDLTDTAQSIADVRRAFVRRRQELAFDRVCNCDGCVQVGALKLKFVAHLGEIAFQKVKRYTELAGVDVILVHRLLKNRVPVSEYVLVSNEVHTHLPEELRSLTTPIDEELEGLGATTLHYLDLEALGVDVLPELAPSLLRRLWGWVAMTWRSIPYFLGVKRSCEGFRNLGAVLPPETTPSIMPPSEG